MKLCLEDEAYFLHSAPDFIFGNNSIYNALHCIKDKGACFSSPVARVSISKARLRKDLKDLSSLEKTISNQKLVSCLFECAHQAIETSFDNNDFNSTKSTGISIRKLDNNSYIVIQNIPSVFLGKFLIIDYIFFHFFNSFNQWDRTWSSILIRSNRLKICGSSDLFFLIELTKDTDKIATLEK